MINILLLIVALLLPIVWLYMIWQGAPYRASQKQAIDNMLGLLGNTKGKRIAELGSGDGRVVIALTQVGAEVHGYEINPFLVVYSRWKIRQSGARQAFIHWQNFWHVNFSEFDTIVLFQLPYFLDKLRPKFERELRPDATIVSNVFKIPSWNYKKSKQSTYLYLVAH